MRQILKNAIKLITLFIAISLAFLIYKHIIVPIKTITSFTQVDFNRIKSGSLVIFDVDETLIQPTDSYYVNEFTPQAIEFKKEFIARHPEITNWDLYADITIKEVQRPLIETKLLWMRMSGIAWSLGMNV